MAVTVPPTVLSPAAATALLGAFNAALPSFGGGDPLVSFATGAAGPVCDSCGYSGAGTFFFGPSCAAQSAVAVCAACVADLVQYC